MRLWLEEIHIPYPDLTLPSGLDVLGSDSVRDKERLVSVGLALQRVPYINKVLGTTIIALLCQIVALSDQIVALSDCQFLAGLLIGHLAEC